MTDPAFLKIQYETLQQAQTDLAVAYTAAHNGIDDLRTKLDQHLAEWTGDARDAYTQAQLDWHRAFEHMAQVLNKAQIHLANAHDLYQAVERQNLSIWHA
jgi:WXG100 family type VII secretion target